MASGRGFGVCGRCKTLGEPTRFRLDRLFVCLDGGGAETGRQEGVKKSAKPFLLSFVLKHLRFVHSWKTRLFRTFQSRFCAVVVL